MAAQNSSATKNWAKGRSFAEISDYNSRPAWGVLDDFLTNRGHAPGAKILIFIAFRQYKEQSPANGHGLFALGTKKFDGLEIAVLSPGIRSSRRSSGGFIIEHLITLITQKREIVYEVNNLSKQFGKRTNRRLFAGQTIA